MAKLKNIVKQLSADDYESIHESLLESNADKSAHLLKALREKHHSDNKIMQDLEVNTNAYYTLRSRLNQKIEEYLLQQMESPRTDLLKKVANINEVIFTKKRAISIATLKKLEKELLDYDLSNELTIVYKALKKLHINTADHFQYSQLYNQHVAYMLAVDKAEDLLADYFRKFGLYALGGEDVEKFSLKLINDEMDNVCKLYTSHRLYVYQSCMSIFHRLFVEDADEVNNDAEPVEDILNKVNSIFETYPMDSIYYHLRLVFEFLRLEYYNHYKVYRKAEEYYEDINEKTSVLISNYSWFTFPAQFLLTKIERCIRHGEASQMEEENISRFARYEADKNDIPKHVYYVSYRAVSCLYSEKYDEASKWLNELLNEVSLKKFPHAMLEIKSILALQYCLMKEPELFNQLVNSIQRQVRILGKEKCDHVVNFIKILKTAISETKRDKKSKIRLLIEKTDNSHRKIFSPTRYIKFDDWLFERLFAFKG